MRYPVYACLRHDPNARLGATVGRTLALWQDDYGLAFRLDIPSSHAGLSLANGVRSNVLRGASFSSPADGVRKLDVAHENGMLVYVFASVHVDEISLCEAGANPEAVCWVDAEAPEDLPDHVRDARSRWHAGRAQAATARPRVTAHARPRTVRTPRPPQWVLAAIDAVLGLPRSPSPPPIGRGGDLFSPLVVRS